MNFKELQKIVQFIKISAAVDQRRDRVFCQKILGLFSAESSLPSSSLLRVTASPKSRGRHHRKSKEGYKFCALPSHFSLQNSRSLLQSTAPEILINCMIFCSSLEFMNNIDQNFFFRKNGVKLVKVLLFWFAEYFQWIEKQNLIQRW